MDDRTGLLAAGGFIVIGWLVGVVFLMLDAPGIIVNSIYTMYVLLVIYAFVVEPSRFRLRGYL